MGKQTMRSLLAALCALLALEGLPGEAIAQEAQAKAIELEKLDGERKRRARLHPVRTRVSRYLGAAAEEIDEGRPEEANRLLLKLNPKRLNPMERAFVYRLLAYVAYGSGNTEKAVEWFEQVLAQEILPIRDEARIRFNIAQLYASLQNWENVILWIDRWLQYTANPDPLGYYLRGIAYYQLENYDAAIVSAEQAIDQTNEPKEAWLRLLAALFAQKEDYVGATPVLEELMLRYPKKQYWVQLALIYGAREKYQRSLAVQQIAYANGMLTQDPELRRLARSYLFHELPYPAAQVLSKGLKDDTIKHDTESLELLANSWIASREYDRSLPPLREAAALSEDGKLYMRLGQVYMQRENWTEAVRFLQKALEKGDLEDPGNVELLLGISFYNDARIDRARSHFVRARQHESSRAEADRWITHLETEAAAQS
ncbi:MAG: tetratricopeptide repeat protein [Myxococcota bacterium]